jgi:hypothetical protein
VPPPGVLTVVASLPASGARERGSTELDGSAPLLGVGRRLLVVGGTRANVDRTPSAWPAGSGASERPTRTGPGTAIPMQV